MGDLNGHLQNSNNYTIKSIRLEKVTPANRWEKFIMVPRKFNGNIDGDKNCWAKNGREGSYTKVEPSKLIKRTTYEEKRHKNRNIRKFTNN